MASSVVLGAQWGDEGKGKIVDMYSAQADVVVRFQGGHNAGHTVWVGDVKYVLHLVPSGIIHKGTVNIIGNGVVVDPAALIEELADIKSKGIDYEGRLFISDRAHVIMPYHSAFDKRKEELKGSLKIGTTGRGIGPCYGDKVGRSGIRIGDLLNLESLKEIINANLVELNFLAKNLYGLPEIDLDVMMEQFKGYAAKLAPFIADTATMVNNAVDAGKKVMLEGAQGTLLDIDFGTYPFVTSSNCTIGGACTGTGLSPRKIGNIVGVTKAYCTRVGSGPFPTELFDATGDELRTKGYEFGATTGRPRRCGWLDLVAMRYSAMLNGITHIALTKLDVLSGMKEINVCIGYKVNGKDVDTFPASLKDAEQIVPVYKMFPGWDEDITKIKELDKLPKNARTYIDFISEFLNLPYCLVSVGPERDETVVLAQML